MVYYFNPANEASAISWDQEYKHLVMSWMIVMMVEMKPTQIKMEELLLLGKENPFDIPKDRAVKLTI